MSESSHLVPYQNEMMEEYTKGEEEVVQKTQPRAVQEEERSEERIEIEQSTEETRKRKRRDKEDEAELREEKASDLVLESAYLAWRDKLQHRDFIGERGFSRLISPFQEIIENRGWHLFCEHKALGFVDVVKNSTQTW